MVSNAGLFAAKLVNELIDDPQEKAQHFSRLEKLAPASYFIEFYLGQNLYNAGKPDEALPHLSQALDGFRLNWFGLSLGNSHRKRATEHGQRQKQEHSQDALSESINHCNY